MCAVVVGSPFKRFIASGRRAESAMYALCRPTEEQAMEAWRGYWRRLRQAFDERPACSCGRCVRCRIANQYAGKPGNYVRSRAKGTAS